MEIDSRGMPPTIAATDTTRNGGAAAQAAGRGLRRFQNQST